MPNRRKRNLMDPKSINEYNNFLSTLDQTSNKNTPNKNTPNNENAGIDLLIDVINNKFIDNKHFLVNFTGQTTNDILNINKIDPNYYRDIIKPISVKGTYEISKKETVDIKEIIDIDIEVNNITDILNIIEKYKCDPSIKYNINMKTLHAIKEPLIELNNMIGINEIKTNVVDQILYFVQELHKNKGTTGDFMHTVIYGPPGTGKTEISKILGKIFSKIGILSKGTFKKVTRSDLIAGFLGQTALKTRDVIKESLGGVLFIDEAYALGNAEKKDIFAKECIDTLCEALSDNKEDLMVIIAGYEKELKECFFNHNQGLDSRFTWRFKIEEYTGEDLYKIFLKKVNDIGWELEENSKINVEWFKKKKDYFKFYGRDIETVLAKTKIAHSKRVFCKPENEKRKINLKDLEKGFELYLKNNQDIKNKKEEEETKKYIYNTIYS
jgi:AAA+ superfamily predicted ATPase